MDTNEKFLPIGSVVLLKGGSKRLMIIGYCSMKDGETKEIYDYSGCLYPEGLISSTQVGLFNHDQIEKIDFKGFVDDEQKKFVDMLKESLSEIESKTNDSDFEKIDV